MSIKENKGITIIKYVFLFAVGIVAAVMGIAATGNLSVFADELVTNLTIDVGVSEIGAYAYTERPLETVTLSDTVSNIGYGAFEECTNLKNVNLNNGLTSIDGHAFSQCFELNNVTIPGSVQNIGNGAFHNCVSLDTVNIPASVQNLDNNVFYGCTSLSNVSLPEGMQSIGQQSFYGCLSLGSMAVPSTVGEIKDGAFYNCQNLQEVVLGDNVKNIGRDAFAGCGKLTVVCNPGSYAEKYAKENGLNIRYAGENVSANADVINTNEIYTDAAGNPVVNVVSESALAQTNTTDATNPGNSVNANNKNSKRYEASDSIVYTPQTGVDIPYVQMTIALILAFAGMLVTINYNYLFFLNIKSN